MGRAAPGTQPDARARWGMTKPNRWTTDQIVDQTGRTVIVTGASSGLGHATAEQLAARGAHVILAVRDQAKGDQITPS